MRSSSDTISTLYVNISEDTLTEILLKFPVKQVIRCQNVCKSWRTLIRSKHFNIIYNHHHSSSHPWWFTTYLIVQNNRVSLYPTSGSSAPKHFSYPSPCKGWAEIVGAAYGAIIFKLRDGLIVWNSFNDKYAGVRIKWRHDEIIDDRLEGIEYVYGLELDYDDYYYYNMCRGFKVVVVSSIYYDDGYKRKKGYTAKVYRLYTRNFFSKKKIQWNITTNITFPQCKYRSGRKNNTVNLNQACHWIARRLGKDDSSRHIIVAFDFKSEKFREISLPFKKRGYSMSAYKGMLCVGFSQVEENSVKGDLVPFHVYVMKEYGDEESWTNLFIIDIHPGLSARLKGVTKDGDVLIHIKKKRRHRKRHRVVSCNPHIRLLPILLDGKFNFAVEPEVCYGQSPLLL